MAAHAARETATALRSAWVVAVGLREGYRSLEATVDAANGQVLDSRWLELRAEAINVYADNPDRGRSCS